MNHLGDTNKMVGEDHIRDATKMVSETPRTDRVLKNCNGWHHVPIELARELERELNEANQRIMRLEELGKELRECAGHHGWTYNPSQLGWTYDPLWIERAEAAVEAWDKEVNP